MTKKTRKTHKMRKVLLTVCCAALLVCVTIGATVAYLTSTETVTNTFTVGKVKITLDEAKVNDAGKPINKAGDVVIDLAAAERVKQNGYHLLPGHTYTKDPTVTVVANSEECYVRMLVTVSDIDALKKVFPTYIENGVFLLEKLVGGWDSTTWQINNVTGNVYEFRYKSTVAKSTDATKLPALFTSITIPGEGIGNNELATLNNITITVEAQAIQADGFTSADLAWAEF